MQFEAAGYEKTVNQAKHHLKAVRNMGLKNKKASFLEKQQKTQHKAEEGARVAQSLINL